MKEIKSISYKEWREGTEITVKPEDIIKEAEKRGEFFEFVEDLSEFEKGYCLGFIQSISYITKIEEAMKEYRKKVDAEKAYA